MNILHKHAKLCFTKYTKGSIIFVVNPFYDIRVTKWPSYWIDWLFQNGCYVSGQGYGTFNTPFIAVHGQYNPIIGSHKEIVRVI